MNCDTAREKILDLVYGELDAAESQSVRDHIRTCGACREEYEKMQLARRALSWGRRAEPAAPTLVTGGEDGKIVRFPSAAWRNFRLGLAAVAAGIVAVAGVWIFIQTGASTAMAQAIEIKRISISLTILSQPADSGGYQYRSRGRDYQRMLSQQAASSYQTVDTGYDWQGMAIVRDQRLVRNLPKGENEVRFAEVPAGIEPDSVRLNSVSHPGAMKILEQNYEYDLASADAVLKRYIDKSVTVKMKENGEISGKLLSFDGKALVLQPAGEGPRNVPRTEVQAIMFEKLPDGLLSSPTLVWQVKNTAEAQQQFEVAYLTKGINWRADYVLKLRTAGAPERPAQSNSVPAITDHADLVGYATVANHSGVTYQDAQLKLLAGDVHLVKPGEVRKKAADEKFYRELEAKEANAQFQEKSFFEYHLYTLGRPTTIKDRETKQIELVSGNGIKMNRGYVFDPQRNATAAAVVSEFKNSKDNGLGRPIPKGVLRLYAPDPTGQDEYVSQMAIDHTPVDEKIRAYWGYAFDIACKATQTKRQASGDNTDETWQYRLRNHKDYDVSVTVVVNVPAGAYRADCKYPWHVKQVGLVEIEVPVPAGKEAVVDFSFSSNWASGGGLKSPFDEKERLQK